MGVEEGDVGRVEQSQSEAMVVGVYGVCGLEC